MLLSSFISQRFCARTLYFAAIALPAAALWIPSGTSTIYLLLLVLAGWVLATQVAARPLTFAERIFIYALVAFFAVAVVSWLASEPTYPGLKKISRYTKFILVIPIILLLSRIKLPLQWVLFGLILGSLVAGVFGVVELYVRGNGLGSGYRIRGAMHAIHYGNLSLLFAALLIAAASQRKLLSPALRQWLWIAISSGLVAAVLSGTRGAWLVVPSLCLIFLWQYKARLGWARALSLAVAGMVVVVIILAIPQTGVKHRVESAWQEYQSYQPGMVIQQGTSIGLRLAMWRAAWDIFLASPVLGVGVGNYEGIVHRWAKEGKIHPQAIFSNPHNSYLMALASRGVIGLLSLLALLLLPLYFYLRATQSKMSIVNCCGWLGVVLIVAYAQFMLTEDMFDRSRVINLYVLLNAFFLSAMGWYQHDNEPQAQSIVK